MTFADAVVAIALTLLVLPLVEIASDLPEGAGLGEVFSDHGAEVGGFVLSFVVIWVLWSAHHRTMEHFAAYDGVILRLTLLFIFSIVVLPFTTQLLTGDLYVRGAVPLYDGVLLLSALSLPARPGGGAGTRTCCTRTSRRCGSGCGSRPRR